MQMESKDPENTNYLNLRNLNDHQLLSATESLVKTEREILLAVLHHLQEIDRRKLYSALKFKSLFEYVVKKLGYSEDQAYRRFSAMRMLKSFSAEVCEQIETKINNGALCLTHLNMAQNLFQKEEAFLSHKISLEQKIEVLEKLENTSTREAERIVLGLSSAPVQIPQEKLRPLTEELTELKAVLNKEQIEKIQRLKGLLAHKNPNMEFTELLNVLLDLGIKEYDPGQKRGCNFRKKESETESTAKPPAAPRLSDRNHFEKDFSDVITLKKYKEAPTVNPQFDAPKPKAYKVDQASGRQRTKATNPRFISAKIRREVWRKHQSRCVNCKSTFALEIDHIHPVALGGTSEIGNLRLTCRSCNQRASRRKLGSQIMDGYVQKSFG